MALGGSTKAGRLGWRWAEWIRGRMKGLEESVWGLTEPHQRELGSFGNKCCWGRGHSLELAESHPRTLCCPGYQECRLYPYSFSSEELS